MAAAPQKLEWRSARIVTIATLLPRIHSFVLELPEAFSFRAGQHVDVRLTALDGYSAERSYSIASTSGARTAIGLVIRKMENGEVSTFFHEVAAVDDEIGLRGPIGGCFI